MNRRGFITGTMALLTAPAIVRASSLDALPRFRVLRLSHKFIDATSVLPAYGYDRVVIDKCGIAAPDDTHTILFIGCDDVVIKNSVVASTSYPGRTREQFDRQSYIFQPQNLVEYRFK